MTLISENITKQVIKCARERKVLSVDELAGNIGVETVRVREELALLQSTGLLRLDSQSDPMKLTGLDFSGLQCIATGVCQPGLFPGTREEYDGKGTIDLMITEFGDARYIGTTSKDDDNTQTLKIHCDIPGVPRFAVFVESELVDDEAVKAQWLQWLSTRRTQESFECGEEIHDAFLDEHPDTNGYRLTVKIGDEQQAEFFSPDTEELWRCWTTYRQSAYAARHALKFSNDEMVRIASLQHWVNLREGAHFSEIISHDDTPDPMIVTEIRRDGDIVLAAKLTTLGENLEGMYSYQWGNRAVQVSMIGTAYAVNEDYYAKAIEVVSGWATGVTTEEQEEETEEAEEVNG